MQRLVDFNPSQTHGGKQTIENVQMIQLAAKLWRPKKGFEDYGEKALKVKFVREGLNG